MLALRVGSKHRISKPLGFFDVWNRNLMSIFQGITKLTGSDVPNLDRALCRVEEGFHSDRNVPLDWERLVLTTLRVTCYQ